MKTWSSYLIIVLAGFLMAQAGLAQQPVITSLQGDGQLTWTNAPGTNAFAVQWAPALTSGWSSAAPALDLTVSTGAQTTVSAPIAAPSGFYRVVEGFAAQSLRGAWIVCDTNVGPFYLMSDGNGALTGLGIFNAAATAGSYTVNDTGGATLTFVLGNDTNTITGQFMPPGQIVFTGSSSNLGAVVPVQDAGLCAGTWNGTFSEINDPNGLSDYSVSLTVDTNGSVILAGDFSGTGRVFALASTNGTLSGFIKTGLDSSDPYNQILISGTLSGDILSGAFSTDSGSGSNAVVGTLILTRHCPSTGTLHLTAPNGLEAGTKSWVVGVPYNITWSSTGTVSQTNLVIELWKQSGSNYVATLATNVTNNGLYRTIIANDARRDYRIHIYDARDPTIGDWSDGDFQLIANLHLTAPDGGPPAWFIGATNLMTWDSPGPLSQHIGDLVTLWMSKDRGAHWFKVQDIVPNVMGTNAYAWATPLHDPSLLSTQALMAVSEPGAPSPTMAVYDDISDSTFVMAGIVATFPATGASVKLGDSINVQWTSAGVGTNVSIQLYDGATWSTLVASTVNRPGTNNCTVPLTALNPTGAALLKIQELPNGFEGMSDPFVLANINILTPVGGTPAVRDHWQIGTTNLISWTAWGAGNSVNIEWSTDGSNWTAIATNYPNSNSLAGVVVTNCAPPWILRGPPSSGAVVRVRSISKTNVFALTGSFDISGVQMQAPKGGEVWEFDGANAVQWYHAFAGGSANLAISFNGGATTNDYEGLATNAPISDSYLLTPGAIRRPSTLARIRVTAVNPPAPVFPMTDASDANFTIRGLSAIYPTNGSVYTLGAAVPNGLQWYSAATEDPQARLTYSADGTNFNDIIYDGFNPYFLNIDAGSSWNHYTWTIARTLTPSSTARVKVSAGAYSAVSPPFTLRGIRITQPAAGQAFDIGTRVYVQWIAAGVSALAYVSNSVSFNGLAGPYVNAGLSTNWSVGDPNMPWDIASDADPSTNAVLRMVITTPANDTDVIMYSDPFTLRSAGKVAKVSPH